MSSGSIAAMGAETRLCAVYGHPVRHSASPAMQNAGMRSLGLDWRYGAFDVPPEKLRVALVGAAAMRFVGVNLTVPHKVLALEMMDALDPAAARWGAVNTVRFEGRDEAGEWQPLARLLPEVVREVRMHGFNTDADAIVRSLREDLGWEPRGARVLLLGAGGAGRVAALRLAAEGVSELWLVNRTEAKAMDLAGEIRARGLSSAVRVEVGYPVGEVDLMLNATSLGLKPGDALPFDEGRYGLHQAKAVYDMVYRPAETPFLAAAKAGGCRTANGLGMLLYQGAAALEIWCGQPAPVETMRRALWETIYGVTA